MNDLRSLSPTTAPHYCRPLLFTIASVVAAVLVKTPMHVCAESPVPGDTFRHTGKFMGTASCSSSNCHGGTNPRAESAVLQNEYVTWYKHDRHAMAYQALLSEDSRKIGAHLGIEKPETEPLCLSCHSTFSPDQTAHGEKYRLEDGVSCESCHGAAEHWLKPHTESGATHTNNMKHGLFDLVPLANRARLCAGCHVGEIGRAVNHRLMGAGHPRMTFELDTFGSVQPAHWNIDDDYRKRKGTYQPAQAWIIGQLVIADHRLALLQDPNFAHYGIMPELTHFSCYSCHHTLDQKRWRTADYRGHPGELRLNVASISVASVGLAGISPEISAALRDVVDSLYRDISTRDIADHIARARALLNERAIPAAAEAHFDAHALEGILKRLLDFAGTHPRLDYEVAEQIAMGIQALGASMDGGGKKYRFEIEELYGTLTTADHFNAQEFVASAKRFQKKLS